MLVRVRIQGGGWDLGFGAENADRNWDLAVFMCGVPGMVEPGLKMGKRFQYGHGGTAASQRQGPGFNSGLG